MRARVHWLNSSKNLQKARYLGLAHFAELERGKRASKEARGMRNTRSTRRRSKCAFQRARLLLFCPAAAIVYVSIELELELIQTQMTQKPMLRAEVYARALRASQNRK